MASLHYLAKYMWNCEHFRSNAHSSGSSSSSSSSFSKLLLLLLQLLLLLLLWRKATQLGVSIALAFRTRNQSMQPARPGALVWLRSPGSASRCLHNGRPCWHDIWRSNTTSSWRHRRLRDVFRPCGGERVVQNYENCTKPAIRTALFHPFVASTDKQQV